MSLIYMVKQSTSNRQMGASLQLSLKSTNTSSGDYQATSKWVLLYCSLLNQQTILLVYLETGQQTTSEWAWLYYCCLNQQTNSSVYLVNWSTNNQRKDVALLLHLYPTNKFIGLFGKLGNKQPAEKRDFTTVSITNK